MTNDELWNEDTITPPQPDFSATLQTLRDSEAGKPGSGAVIYGLSGLTDAQMAQVKPIWEQLQPETRRKIMRGLAEIGEMDFMVDYSAMGFFCLDDPDSGVRAAAIDALWIDESPALLDRLINMAQTDPDDDVRASATSELGRFILLGEYEELPEEAAQRAQETAVRLWQNVTEPLDVRRRALEAISRCGHKIVPEAITEAYDSPHQSLRVSALFAMGCTHDERWTDTVMEEIENDDPEIRYEAARAAGQLELVQAVPALARLCVEDDREIQLVAVWSLGEIGGREVMRILDVLARKAEAEDDDDLADAVEDALVNATLVNDLRGMI